MSKLYFHHTWTKPQVINLVLVEDDCHMSIWHPITTILHSQAKNYSTEAGTEHYFNGSPRLSRQNIQIAGKSDAGQ